MLRIGRGAVERFSRSGRRGGGGGQEEGGRAEGVEVEGVEWHGVPVIMCERAREGKSDELQGAVLRAKMGGQGGGGMHMPPDDTVITLQVRGCAWAAADACMTGSKACVM